MALLVEQLLPTPDQIRSAVRIESSAKLYSELLLSTVLTLITTV